MSAPDTLLGSLERAAGTPEGVRFVERRDERFVSYREMLERVRTVAGGLAERGVRRGERVGVAVRTSPEFYEAFFGILAAGAVPLSLPLPPRFAPREDFLDDTAAMLEAAGAKLILADASQIARFAPLGALPLDDLSRDACLWNDLGPDALALVQLSSGTTGSPKAIGLTHRQVLSNVRAMLDAFFTAYPEEEGYAHGGVSWLPLYHDMGLVGSALTALVHPGPLTLMNPEEFVARPARWLNAISRQRATISAAPNFAYELALERVRDDEIRDADLSCWLFALNGAEPVTSLTLTRFYERFRHYGLRLEALSPVYGLAEASLAVTFSDLKAPFVAKSFDRDALLEQARALEVECGQELVACGKPLPGMEVRIADEEGEALDEGLVGRVLVKGPSVTTDLLGPDGFLDTGDRGFRFEGELYLCGRTKDLVVVRGRNYPPEAIEQAVDGIEGLRAGAVAAVGVLGEQGEGLWIVAECAELSEATRESLEDEIRGRIVERCGVAPDRVLLVASGALPRTSSGKIRRHEAARRFGAAQVTF